MQELPVKIPIRGGHIVVQESWSTNTAISIAGWVAANPLVEGFEMEVEGQKVSIPTYPTMNLDLPKKYPSLPPENIRDFFCHTNRRLSHNFAVEIDGKRTEHEALGSSPRQYPTLQGEVDLFQTFCQMANKDRLSVLELGSRQIHNPSRRNLFKGYYVGMDVHPGPAVDVVGDAHELSKVFSGQKFDAIFSLSVMEHIAMPWVVAREINKCLNPGGITYHQIPFGVALHELPWDFWRPTHQGVKVLFSKPLGFEIIDCDYGPAISNYYHMTPHPNQMSQWINHVSPLGAMFVCSRVLARKVGEASEGAVWDIGTSEVAEGIYPPPRK